MFVLRGRPSSVETISGEDDVIEVSMDENSNEKSEKEEPQERKLESTEKINFLNALGLITTKMCAELQNKRAERKRRSTANPQFVYSSLEVPTVNMDKFLIIILNGILVSNVLYAYFRNENDTRTCNLEMFRKLVKLLLV